MLVGYARISTQDQFFNLQSDALLKAGCEEIFQDVATGGHIERTGLKEALEYLRPNDTLVVWRLDRNHGFPAPSSDLRSEIIGGVNSRSYGDGEKVYRPAFSELMSRVFDIDVLLCPRCHSRMQLISSIHNGEATKKILKSLRMRTAPPFRRIEEEWVSP